MLEKQNTDQGKALDKLTNDVENHNKIRNLVEELRVWKEKVKKLEKACKKDKETRKEQIERIKRTEEENLKYQEELEGLMERRKAKQAANEKQEEVPDIDLITYEKDQMKMEFVEEEKRQKIELRTLEKRSKELNEKAEDLRKDLKEKEQEQRISTYKLNELRRSIKHNQLKPLPSSKAEPND